MELPPKGINKLPTTQEMLIEDDTPPNSANPKARKSVLPYS